MRVGKSFVGSLLGAVGCACLIGFAASADSLAAGAPSNEELYQMLLELKAEQQRLVDDAAAARNDAARAREQLSTTQQELQATRRELEELQANAQQTPAVSAQPADQKGWVREADLPLSVGVFGEANFPVFSHGEHGFVTLTTEEDPVFGSGSNRIVNPKHDAGWAVGATFAPGGSIDFSFSYTMHEDFESSHVEPPYAVSNDNVFTGLNAYLAPLDFGRDAVAAKGHTDLEYRSIDADVGENLLLGEHIALRLFAGVRYTDIGEHFRAYYFGGDFPDDIGVPLECDMEDCGVSGADFSYWGVGPRVGMRGRYHLPWGFNVFGQAGVSLLVGKLENESVFATDGGETEIASVYRDSGIRVIPAVDIRAGLGWERALGDWGAFFVDGGYQFENYFNVVEHFAFDSLTSEGAFSTNRSDLGIHGPYVRGGFTFYGP